MAQRSYQQNCPIAKGLDVLGERWTLLIVRELVGGARRYGDLKTQLPGIATNLLATRLRELEDAGLVDRTELPAPIARTVYTLSDIGWQKIPPVLRAVALFGVDRLDPEADAMTPLNGFLAGVLTGFDPAAAAGLEASYRVDIDGRRFEFAVKGQRLAAAAATPDVTATAAAPDLVGARFAATPTERKAALERIVLDGASVDVAAMLRAFHLTGDPGAFPALVP